MAFVASIAPIPTGFVAQPNTTANFQISLYTGTDATADDSFFMLLCYFYTTSNVLFLHFLPTFALLSGLLVKDSVGKAQHGWQRDTLI